MSKNKGAVRSLDPADMHLQNAAVFNELLTRAHLAQSQWNGDRDVDKACGYPQAYTQTPQTYREFFDYHGIATRVVQAYPEACWEDDPEVRSGIDEDDTFADVFNTFEREWSLFSFLHRVDELSGIGRFGLIFFGLDDGAELHEPVEGVPIDDKPLPNQPNHEVMFVRVFDESVVEIDQWDTDRSSARYGKPVVYTVDLNDPKNTGTIGTGQENARVRIHWTRVVHIADTRVSDELFGTPRMQRVFHRLWDIRKILGGSGEMFWQGGFPGIAFEVSPEVAGDVTVDKDSMKKEMQEYTDGMRRYIAATGLRAKTLTPNIGDPASHFETQVRAIAITLSVPYRVFMGTEEAKLAGEKDDKAWTKRVKRRRAKYVGPMLVRPVVQRLMMYGALPYAEDLLIEWPQAETMDNSDRIANAKAAAEALSVYVNGGVDTLIQPVDFLVLVLGIDREQAEAYVGDAIDLIDDANNEPEVPPLPPLPPMQQELPVVDLPVEDEDNEDGDE